MKYPFYKHKDIKLLYTAVGFFAVLFLFGLSINYGFWYKIRILSELVLICLTITIIGHEIIIVLLDIGNRRRWNKYK